MVLNKKIFIFLFISIILFNFVNSENLINNLGTYKQGECVRIVEICDMGCSYVTVTSILGPSNNSIVDEGMSMSSIDTYSWWYDFCNTSDVGVYTVITQGDNGDIIDNGIYQFMITQSEFGTLVTSTQI
ncbi:hypothetical protein GYA25_00555 [Candidatus Woesearchaeota archaeon]|nr:hypothetical protein [Candidatus Woesearchaeota archaeon]